MGAVESWLLSHDFDIEQDLTPGAVPGLARSYSRSVKMFMIKIGSM